jgi:hypothetical protein
MPLVALEHIEVTELPVLLLDRLHHLDRSPSFVNLGKTETRNSVRYTRQGMGAVSQGRPDQSLVN